MSPSSLPRCRDCGARIRFLGSPFTGKTRAFDHAEVDQRAFPGAAFPRMGGRAWKFTELAVEIQQLRECSLAEAEDEVRDMPWVTLHECAPATTTASGGGA